MKSYVDFFIWIGCGYQNKLRFLKRLCDKTVLIDGDSRVYQNWKITSSGINERFVNRVVSAKGGQVRFNVYSDSYFNSIASASLIVPDKANLISKQTTDSAAVTEMLSSFKVLPEKKTSFILAIDIEDPLSRIVGEVSGCKILDSVKVLVLRGSCKRSNLGILKARGFTVKGVLKSGEDKYTFLVNDECSQILSKEIEDVFGSFKCATINLDELSSSLPSLLIDQDILCSTKKAPVSDELQNYKEFVACHTTLATMLGVDSIILDYNNWSLAPDALLCIVRLISEFQVDTVIEFGSGLSTKLISSLLRRGTLSLSTFISYEHDREFYEQTKSFIKAFGLEKNCNLQLCPLEPIWESSEELEFYGSRKTLQQINNCESALVIVDGPPSSGGNLARYPALPIVLDNLSWKNLIIFLDDYNRDQEKEIVIRWEALCKSRGLNFSIRRVPLFKGAAILSLRKI